MSTPPTVIAPASNRHYERLGGHEAVQRLVDAFYRAMDTRPDAATVRAMHAEDLGPTRAVLVSYLSEWMGGPRAYTARRGSPMLRRRHQPWAIGADARDAWMACMRQAMSECEVEPGLRAELDAAFYKVADFIRNTEPGGSTRDHPGRPMEQAPGATPITHASGHASGHAPTRPSTPAPHDPPNRSHP